MDETKNLFMTYVILLVLLLLLWVIYTGIY